MCFLFIELRKNNTTKLIKNIITNQKILLFLNFLISLPLVFFVLLKINVYHASDRGLTIDQSLNIIESFKFVITQIILSLNSIQTGFLPILFSSFNLYFLILLIFLSFYAFAKFNKTERVLFEISLLYLIFWIILYIFEKLPLDQTRHSLIFFPIYIFLIGLVFNKIKRINLISFFLIIILLVPSINLNNKTLNEKKSIFNYELISKFNIKNIYTFSDTLSPFLYFNDDFNIKNLDLNSFRKNYNISDEPDEILLVSQNQSFLERNRYDKFIKNLNNNYNIEIIEETKTNIYMPYNNYNHHSTQNGFYLYKLIKKN